MNLVSLYVVLFSCLLVYIWQQNDLNRFINNKLNNDKTERLINYVWLCVVLLLRCEKKMNNAKSNGEARDGMGENDIQEPTREEARAVAAASAAKKGFCPLRTNANDAKTRAQRIYTALLAADRVAVAEEYRALHEPTLRAHRGEYDLLAVANGARLEFSEDAGQLKIAKGTAEAVITATENVRAALQAWLDRTRSAFVAGAPVPATAEQAVAAAGVATVSV